MVFLADFQRSLHYRLEIGVYCVFKRLKKLKSNKNKNKEHACAKKIIAYPSRKSLPLK